MGCTRINNIEELNNALKEECFEFFILLGGGLVRSSKHIEFASEPNTYYVFHEIDGTEETLTAEDIMDEEKSNIGKAIKNGYFFREIYD